MMNKREVLSLALALAMGLLLAGVTLAQTGGGYDLSWWTLDGGEGKVEGDGYTLMGTAGLYRGNRCGSEANDDR